MLINLKKELFSNREETFLEYGEQKVFTYMNTSGICSLKVTNKYGHIEVLPFNGQMIWDAVFNNRSLTMKTTYDEPRNVESFLDTYGCYLMHCGVLKMGCPGPEDDHPLHGELPYADYDTAAIITGKDEKGIFVGVTGTFEYNRAFADNYIMRPVVKLYENSTLIDVTVNIENLSNYPLELMYMCHINNRAVVGGRIVQSVPWEEKYTELRSSIPQHYTVSEDFKEFLEKIKGNIKIAEVIKEEDVYIPEICFFLHHPKVDKDGYTHSMFVHPDNSADYTSYKPEELDHCTRWYARTMNKEALGLALPATADAEGYTAEKQKGNIKIIGPKDAFKAHLIMGYISSDKVKQMEDRINNIN